MKLKNPLNKIAVFHDKEETDITHGNSHVKENNVTKKKIGIPKINNPITEIQRKREEEKRHKEEELRRKREQEERKRKRASAQLAGMGCVCLIGLGIMYLNEKKPSEPEAIVTAEPSPVSTETPALPSVSTPPPSKPVTGHSLVTDAALSETEETTESTESTHLSESAEKPEPVSTQEPNPYHRLDNMSISARTDYGHFSESTIVQGNGETFYVAIDTKNKEATVDDVIMYYDDTEIQILSKEFYSEGFEYPRVEYHCQAVKEGDFEIQIASSYDDYNSEQTGMDYDVYYLDIKKLSWRDGQVVYLSYSGDKYHKSSAHAGDSWTAVTLWDAENMAIEPCGTCY